jgi:hypothetical protein
VAERRRFCRDGEIMVRFVLVSQFPCFVFANKVRQLKIDLKRLNKEVLKNVEESKRFLMEEIPSLDYLEEDICLIEEKRISRAKVKADLENVALVQGGSWRQKSKENWLKEGDHNAGVFTALPTHRRNNFISNLNIDSIVTSYQEEIIDSIIQYLKNLFYEIVHWHPKLDGLEFSDLDSSEVYWLETLFSRGGSFHALLSMDVDNPSCPDGFTIAFPGHVGL